MNGYRALRFLICPDSYKGSIPAHDAADIIASAGRDVFPGAFFDTLPVADGGEGTLNAIIMALGGTYREANVTSPYGKIISAKYGVLNGGETAVIEMATASGLMLSEKRSPMEATSRGFGELMLSAINSGARHLIVGIGGSATNDGGMGMLTGLGGGIYGKGGMPLYGCGSDLQHAATVLLPQLPARVKISVICDVTNVLLGENGATMVFGRQKGASPQQQAQLESGMESYQAALSVAAKKNIADAPGSGAAGGTGAALHALGAEFLRGIDAVLDLLGFGGRLAAADAVITGEGCFDMQTVKSGKAVAGILARCAAAGKPAAVVAGSMECADAAARDYPVITSVCRPMDIKQAMENAPELLHSAARRMFDILKQGMRIGQIK